MILNDNIAQGKINTAHSYRYADSYRLANIAVKQISIFGSWTSV